MLLLLPLLDLQDLLDRLDLLALLDRLDLLERLGKMGKMVVMEKIQAQGLDRAAGGSYAPSLPGASTPAALARQAVRLPLRPSPCSLPRVGVPPWVELLLSRSRLLH